MDSLAALSLPVVPGPATESSDWPAQQPDWAEFERDGARALPEGLHLRDYEIVGPIGEGGLGVVYLAWDHAQQHHVAIKEYLPAVLAVRDRASTAVVVRSPQHQDSFRIGLRSFVNEARILARFDHPALVRVLHHWEDNGTAYMAMPYYQGPTLARALAGLGRPPEEAELRAWLRPLLDALGTMHALSCFHRDVAPDNILLTDSGPVLLDFGAARRVIDGAGQSPAVVFKPGFTPVEQYGELASMRQGPWTDLYALAAVVYTAITGQPPISSIERMPDDPLQPLRALARGRYSDPFLAAVDAALSVLPQDRPQSAAEFRARLGDDDGAACETDGGAADSAPGRPPASDAAETPALHAAVRSFLPSIAAPSARRVEPLAAMAPRPRSKPAPVQRNRFKLPALAGTAAVLIGLVTAGHYRIGDRVRTDPPLAVLAALPATPAVPLTPTASVAPVASVATAAPVASTAPTMPMPSALPAAAASTPTQDPRPVAAMRERTRPAPVPGAADVQPLRVVAVPSMAPDAPRPARSAEAAPSPRRTPRPAGAPAAARADPLFGTVSRPPVQARPARREAPALAAEPPARLLAGAAPSREGRCSELLLRASLEPLGAVEAASLKRGCE
ncbi:MULTISPECIES: serine/threonine-protein kinase [unclassified Variovorax]|uniref:serine/threonine protein kinase n=1 Tax=unclassified Variovorax TaxID=663243 RepID=UPI00076C8CA9|nr:MULTISPECIES: serine/threonine-protein kinase [unclassified Variovorax]KWT75979.1 putative serine/threonine protein kinase [Variovorax sp. WDL1]PNG51601.1 Serine/threonine-protein kinase D [Variovorax sp. B2]PNG54373.1 Serine/threonine-protein kinase D [Variovorax sp. B4]VTV11871.1 Serine/threonine-protein kinase D [Variovorax sp. WDL1]